MPRLSTSSALAHRDSSAVRGNRYSIQPASWSVAARSTHSRTNIVPSRAIARHDPWENKSLGIGERRCDCEAEENSILTTIRPNEATSNPNRKTPRTRRFARLFASFAPLCVFALRVSNRFQRAQFMASARSCWYFADQRQLLHSDHRTTPGRDSSPAIKPPRRRSPPASSSARGPNCAGTFGPVAGIPAHLVYVLALRQHPAPFDDHAHAISRVRVSSTIARTYWSAPLKVLSRAVRLALCALIDPCSTRNPDFASTEERRLDPRARGRRLRRSSDRKTRFGRQKITAPTIAALFTTASIFPNASGRYAMRAGHGSQSRVQRGARAALGYHTSPLCGQNPCQHTRAFSTGALASPAMPLYRP